MAGISDLVRELGDENIEFQLLNQSLKSKQVKGKKNDKYSEFSFHATPDKMEDDREAIIIWTTVKDFNAALYRAKQEA
tara:strand:- start:111 stop:344 length:234 start_codon:yes stop_codon:yes gene_type:complete